MPNELGIYDMSGNVREWCYDWYDDGDTTRVLRNGDFSHPAQYSRITYRDGSKPESKSVTIGFRVVFDDR